MSDMERVDYFSPDGEWWVVHDPYNGNDGYELIHLPTRDKGGDGSQGEFPSLFAAQGVAADIMEGARELWRGQTHVGGE